MGVGGLYGVLGVFELGVVVQLVFVVQVGEFVEVGFEDGFQIFYFVVVVCGSVVQFVQVSIGLEMVFEFIGFVVGGVEYVCFVEDDYLVDE